MRNFQAVKRSHTSLFQRWWVVPLLIYFAALAVRVVYLNQIEAMPTFTHPIMDERYHIQLAQQIGSTTVTQSEAFFRAPLYPYFLSFLYNASEQSFYWIRFFQILLTSLVPPLVYLLFTRLQNRTVGFWSAAILGFYPTSLHFDTSLLIESLMPLLLVLVVWQLVRTAESLFVRDFLMSGLLLGVATITRPNILLLLPFLVFWFWFIIKPKLGLNKAIRSYAILTAACFVVIFPVTIRNYLVSDDFVLVAWQGGVNFYIGNNRLSNGWSATIPGVDQTWEGGYRETINIPQQAMGKTLKPSEISDYWYNAAWKEINQDIAGWISRLFTKFRILINGYEIANNQSEYMSTHFSPLLRVLMWAKPIYFPFGVVAPLALLGLLISLSQWRKLMAVYLVLGAYAISLILFFVCARFRQPMIPLLIPFAVLAVVSLINYLREHKWKNVTLFLLVFGIFAVESNHNLLGINDGAVRAEELTTIGNAFYQSGKIDQAAIYYQKTLQADSTYAQGYINRGMLAHQSGNKVGAEADFRKAIRLAPGLTEAYLNLSTVLLDMNNKAGAIQVLLDAKRFFPINDQVSFRLGMTLFENGQVEEGIAEVRRAIQLNPNNSSAVSVLQQMLQYQQSIQTP